MTAPVGSIRLDLTVDGSNVDQEILAAAHKAMGPVLAEANARMAELTRNYNQLGAAAEKAGAKQAAANKTVDESFKPTKQVAGYEAIAKAAKEAAAEIARVAAAEKLRDKATDGSAKRVAGMEAESAAARKEARDMLELAAGANAAAAALDRLTAANTRAAVGPKPDYNRPLLPPGGGGGGGGRSGSSSGGFGGGGILGSLLSPVGVNAIALSTKALAPMALGIAEVVRSVQDLASVGAVVPGVIAGIGASGLTAAVGMKGMGDAIGAMYKAAQAGASKGDLKKAAEAIGGMDSNAKAVAVTIASDLLPQWKKLQTDVVQHNMFAGIADSLKDTSNKLLPTFKTGLGGISSAWNNTFKTLLGTAGSDSSKGFLDRIFGNTAEAQNRANAAIAPLTHAFGTLTAQGTNFLPRLADGLTKVSTRFDNFISGAVADGRFDKWVDNGLKAVGDLGESFLNVGKILNDITSSLGGGQTFLGWLKDATGQLHTFLSSADGQNKLSSFFQSAREEWSQIKPVLVDITKLAGDVVAGFHEWGNVILPVVGSITHGLAQMPGLIAGVVAAFAGIKTIKGLSEFIGLTGAAGAAGKAGSIGGKAGAAGAAGGGLLSNLWLAGLANANPQTALGMAQAQRYGSVLKGLGAKALSGPALASLLGLSTFSGIQQSAQTPGGMALGALGTLGTSTALGATIGSFVPGVGTAIGAGVGLAAGSAIAIYNAAVNGSEAAARKAAAAQQDLADKMAHAAATTQGFKDSNKSIQDSLLNNGGKIDDSTRAALDQSLSLIPDKFKDMFGDGAQVRAKAVRDRMGVSDDQLSQIVSGSPDVFAAFIANLNKQGGDAARYGIQLGSARDQLFARQRAAQTAAPVVGGISNATGETPAQVSVDLHTLASSLQAGIPLKIDDKGSGQGIAERLKQGGIDLGKPLTPTDLAQINAATGQNFVIAPGGGIMLPALPGVNVPGSLFSGAQLAPPGLTPGDKNAPPPASLFGGGPIPVQIVNPAAPAPTPAGAVQPTDLGGLLGVPAAGTNAPTISPQIDPKAQQDITNFATSIKDINSEVHIQAPDIPRVKTDLDGLNAQITDVSKNEIAVKANDDAARSVINNLISSFQGKTISLNVVANQPPVGGGHANGGVIPGYSPGIDNVLYPLSGGEGILIPEAVRGLGGSAGIYAINSRFRAGLSRQGYADGGVNGPTIGIGLGGDSTVIGLLSQIRDLLAGRGGNSAPLNATADGVSSLAGDVKGGTAGTVGGARTGGKRNLLWDTAASFIAMFGGDPYSILGADPSSAAAGGSGAGGRANLIGPLSQFAHTGQFGPDLSTLGLAPNSQVINAITTARDKKKNGLSDDQIGTLIDQVLSTGTYSGQLDNTNKSLINSLLKLGGGTALAPRPGKQDTAGVFGAGDGLPTAPGLPGANIATTGAPIPVYIVSGPGAGGTGATGAVGGPGGKEGFNPAAAGADALTQAVGGALQQILPDILGRTLDAMLAGNKPTGDTVTKPDNLVSGVANLLGYKVTDFTRQGDPSAKNLLTNDGPGYQANGQLLSDTSSSVDRTLTNMEAANQARQKQLLQVLNQIGTQLSEQVLKPLIQDAVTAAINAAGSASQAAAGGHAAGGVLPGYSPGVDNLVGTLRGRTFGLSGGEGILIPEAVRGLGGPAAIYAINSRYRSGLSRTNYSGFADGGTVNGNATVGADFFGLSQVPIIGDLINMIVEIFLAVIGVQISVRNTLTDMTKEIRGFRGDFKAFDASGRLASDTAALTARSQTSNQIAEQQRMRVLKDIIIGAIKFVIEDVLIPLLKAAIQAAINFGTQAISGAIGAGVSGVSFGAGGGLASSLANAAVGAIGQVANQAADIFMNILSSVLTNGAQVLVEALGNAIMGLFPNILNTIAGLFSGIGSIITGVLKTILSPFALIGHAIGLFDEGGIASGIGMMPKGTLQPERVLSPGQTKSFDRLVDAITSPVGLSAGGRQIDLGGVTINVDREDTARKIGNHLMDLAMA